MRLRFTKMHGLGNDFLVLNGCDQPLPEDGPPLSVAELRRLGDRHFGVGFDQMLVVQPPRHELSLTPICGCRRTERCRSRRVLTHTQKYLPISSDSMSLTQRVS